MADKKSRVKTPGRMLGAIGRRLRGARYVAGDVLYALGRLPRAVGRGAAAGWRSLPVVSRRRLAAALGAGVALIVLFALVVPSLPCELPGGDRCPPDDDAIALVPADALAYAHVNLDPDSDQYAAAAELAGRMPLVSRQVLGSLLPLVIGSDGAPASFERDVAPWAGGELAVAVIGSASRERQVQLIEVADEEGARAYAAGIAAGEPRTSTHRDVEIGEDERGLASAIVGDFLVLGPLPAVREVIDVATGAEGAAALAEDATAGEALDALPAERFAEAYLSRAGLEALAAGARSPLAPVEPLLDTQASRGAAVSLGADGDALALTTRSLLDPERAEARPGFFAAFEPFEPELPERLAAGTLAYLGLGDPSATAAALLRQATARAPAIASGFTDLVERLQRTAGVDLEADLLPALAGEAALAVVPRAGGEQEGGASLPGEEPPATVVPGARSVPYLELLATGVDEERARDALARLQGPLARALDPELGAPVFDDQEIDGVEARVLRVSPTVQLAYAIFDSTLAAATDPQGVRRAITDEGESLAGSERFERAAAGWEELGSEPLLAAYLDLRELLRFGERSGLAADTAYATFAPDLRRLDVLALALSVDDGVLGSDTRLLIESP